MNDHGTSTIPTFLQLNLNRSPTTLSHAINHIHSNGIFLACFQEAPIKNGTILQWPFHSSHKLFYKNQSNICQYSAILLDISNSTGILLDQFTNDWFCTVKFIHQELEAIVVSAYLHTANNIILDIAFLRKILHTFPNENVIFCFDSNAHSEMWGNKTKNLRGKEIEDFISSESLHLINSGNIPTWHRPLPCRSYAVC